MLRPFPPKCGISSPKNHPGSRPEAGQTQYRLEMGFDTGQHHAFGRVPRPGRAAVEKAVVPGLGDPCLPPGAGLTLLSCLQKGSKCFLCAVFYF